MIIYSLMMIIVGLLVFMIFWSSHLNARVTRQLEIIKEVKNELSRKLLVHELTIDAHKWTEIPPHKVIHVVEAGEEKGGA